ncbi:DUF2482 family protein [Staphylococcus sp. LKG3-3]|uniref:DUF2482 family protein n=1 Tax=Staphylococcus sp. LKG3-3 TaxID=3399685 RepID=UPI003D5A14D7
MKNVKELNIEGLSENEISKILGEYLQAVFNLVERVDEELGYEIGVVIAGGIVEGDSVLAHDKLLGSSSLIMNLAAQTSTLQRVDELNSLRKMLDMPEDYEDDE